MSDRTAKFMQRPRDSFDKRAAKYTEERISSYNDATHFLPHAREKERQLVIDQLRLAPGHDICDVGAGGGYLSEGIDEALDGACNIVCVENSQHFLDSVPDRFQKVLSSLNKIPLPDSSFDRLAVLAGLHHLQRKEDFFSEAFRLLKNTGRMVIADVLADSPPARFLNGPVDQFTDIGHDGMFFERGDLTALSREAGFSRVGEMVCHFDWEFPDRRAMVQYCKSLFRMTKASLDEVDTAIRDHLEVRSTVQGVCLNWSLITVCADKSEHANSWSKSG